MNVKLALEVRYVFNSTKNGITKYISFITNVNKKDLVRISNADNSAFFIYYFFYMLDSMTIMRTIWPFSGQIIKKIEDHYPAIQSDECNLFYVYNWIQCFILTYNDTTVKKNYFINK